MHVDNKEISFRFLVSWSYVPVAQGIERLPSKQRVAGSNPAWDAKPCPSGIWLHAIAARSPPLLLTVDARHIADSDDD